MFILEKCKFNHKNNDFIIDNIFFHTRQNLFKNWQIKSTLDKIFFVCEKIYFIYNKIDFICEIFNFIYDKKNCVRDKMYFFYDKINFLPDKNFVKRYSEWKGITSGKGIVSEKV